MSTLVIGWIATTIAAGLALALVAYSAWKLICAFSQLRDLGSVGVAEPLPEMDIEPVEDCRAIELAIAVVKRCWPDDSGAMVEVSE